jgi:mRNA-degrading endonuclease RelE of RelBE toxin-antitoxin system
MNVKGFLYSPQFRKSIKVLSKKYPSIKESLKYLEDEIKNNPFSGVSYGDNIYKIRLADPSKKTGKSGGFRVFYYQLKVDSKKQEINILFISIINKSDEETIKKNVVSKLKDSILSNMKGNP